MIKSTYHCRSESLSSDAQTHSNGRIREMSVTFVRFQEET